MYRFRDMSLRLNICRIPDSRSDQISLRIVVFMPWGFCPPLGDAIFERVSGCGREFRRLGREIRAF